MRTLTYFIGTSLDGFIAEPDGGLGMFAVSPELLEFVTTQYPETLPGQVRAQLGLSGPGKHFDTIVQGRASYALALDAGVTSPYPHLRQYVVSSTLAADIDPDVTVIPSDPLGAIRELKQADGGGIYLAGGGMLAGQLLAEIDELVVKVYPVVAGGGVPLFGGGFAPVGLTPARQQVLGDGTAVLGYRLKRPGTS
ncbi:bifunctional deaminase-reductase domain protein [Kribbella flavida DSM 17836]|uniref:Bifunctional deaminase-reductase domain protein n=1 Tax=Kribbella flavida (strain DSM 17836 / JCM 10339 / NBRC 14399) TaxID=479435 RepID=D2Q3L4_KRIFD|nr:dihydrofolate reductase family protein [Kribbella flavida]ADB34137.1 bifunctional deaminase-reductase domain protein [Kribbella flavida DSM 17836]